MKVTKFTELQLDNRLMIALHNTGYTNPTLIQAQVIPLVMNGCDILASSPTGTGKTAAFLLPVLQHLLDFPHKKSNLPRILILTPTRELAIQVGNKAREFARYTSLEVSIITGGVAYMNHSEVFRKNQDIIVATTGRLLQYIQEDNFDCSEVETLILDEADRMLDMGFAHDIATISAKTYRRNQTLLFSATLESKAIKKFSAHMLKKPIKVETDPLREKYKQIHQWYYHADNIEHKKSILAHLLQQSDVKKSVIFVRKRERVHELASWLYKETGIHTYCLEGNMAQSQRNEALKRMIDGRINVLIATDIAARGLDIMNITHVFNFDMPRESNTYLHRIGRTGRAGCKGTAISLVEAHDNLLLGKVQRYLNEKFSLGIIKTLRPKNKINHDQHNTKRLKKTIVKRVQDKVIKKAKAKIKMRHRNTKNIGKRRQAKI